MNNELKREWIKLTDNEIQEAYDLISEKEWVNSETKIFPRISHVSFIVRILEKKLMEKNQ